MALKKSQLYSSLWQSCDELRGGMDASQYKDYVLTLLFMKYVSDKYAGKRDEVIEIPEGGGFEDMVALKGDKEIGDKINMIIARLAEANDLKGVIDQADFNDEDRLGRGKEMQDRLSKLVSIFDGLDFRANRAEGDDLLGDAYEYLMRHFATESGKSKGQFYTPAEVSRIMAQVVGLGAHTTPDQTIYDPTCGSGSLLLKAADEAPRGITIYGQENDNATWALARMNMILHGHPTADLWRGNTLADPYFKNADGSLKTFDYAVANPPFSTKSWSNGLNPLHDEFERFAYGIPPAKNGDYAFLLHLVKSLKSKGKGAVILPHGVLFRGNKEAEIRKELIKRGLIKGIIGLPANLFYGTGIPACIIVIDKENAHARGGIFMIDASKGFIKDGNKNRLRAQDIHRIVDVFNFQREVPRFSRMVPVSEVASEANDYNLNLPRYIDSGEPEDLHDLDCHLNGGIPERDLDALELYWTAFPGLRETLFTPGDRDGVCTPTVKRGDFTTAIREHAEFRAYAAAVADRVGDWCDTHREMLRGLEVDALPKAVIRDLSEDLLARFAELPLLDRYDVYQRLMDYWAETMQDDVYLIAADGWMEAAKPRPIIEDKERKIKETPDLVIGRKKYKMDLVPPGLLIARYFQKEQAELDRLEAAVASAEEEKTAFEEEHGGDEGALNGLEGKGGIPKGNVQDRVMELRQAVLDVFGKTSAEAKQAKAIKRASFGSANWKTGVEDGDGYFEELDVLHAYLALADKESESKKAHKTAVKALHGKVLAHYGKLSEDEVKSLVVDDKWFAAVRGGIDSEIQTIARRLADRLRELDERYAQPLPELKESVDVYADKVEFTLDQLLSGKTRLPGFSGEWVTRRLGDHVRFLNHGTNSRAELKPTGKVRYLHYGDIHANAQAYLDPFGLPALPEDKAAGLDRLQDGDLVFADASEDTEGVGKSVEIHNVGETELVAGLHTITARFDKEVLADGFKAYLQFYPAFSAPLKRLAAGTKVYATNRNHIAGIELPLPSVEEQTAIANVLSDMDAEIEAMEARLTKTRQLKQGMMQHLLTGRIRLVEPSSEDRKFEYPEFRNTENEMLKVAEHE